MIVINVLLLYGMVDNGLIFDMLVILVNYKEKVVCLEYRCVGVVFDGLDFVWNLII